MRTLKYRTYIRPLKRYAEKYETILFHHQCNMEPTWTVNISPEEYYGDEDLVIEQFTGLLDRNGKEIYEGDRIKIEGSDCVYTVEYGRGVWVARFGDEPGDNVCLYHYVQKDIVLYAEVIGNIHEPPKDFRPEHLKRMGVSICKGDKA